MDWKHGLRVRTQSREFLVWMVVGVLASGLVLGQLASLLGSLTRAMEPQEPFSPSLPPEALWNALPEQSTTTGDAMPVEQLLELLAALSTPLAGTVEDGRRSLIQDPLGPQEAESVSRRIGASSLDVEPRQIASELWASLRQGAVTELLNAWSQVRPPRRFANHAVGAFHLAAGDLSAAAAAFEREGEFPGADRSRRWALRYYGEAGDDSALQRLARQEAYVELMPALTRMRLAALEDDWWTVWWQIPRHEWERFSLGAGLGAVGAGLGWLAVCLQAGLVGDRQGTRWPLSLIAVVLGCLSIWPTQWCILCQEVHWNLQPAADWAGGIRYYVAGVGLREELCKLLLFVPLIPWLLRRRNELEVLVVGSCVGLGFAMWENIHYFGATGGSSSVGRFLTANFFHMAATGLLGLYLMRGLWSPRWRLLDAAAYLLVIVFAHGIYDAAMAVPELAEYAILSPMVFILLAYLYFHELRQLRPPRQETVSLTATFLLVVSVLIAGTFVVLCGQLGSWAAAQLLVPQVLSLALMIYLFLREMPNSLIRT